MLLIIPKVFNISCTINIGRWHILIIDSAISADEAGRSSVADLMSKLSSNENGLSNQEAEARGQKYGPNEILEEKINPFIKFLGYFWGTIPWMIETAAILSAILSRWDDFAIIFLLLLMNGVVGFWQERKADNAIELLKKRLAPMARVQRDGLWKGVPSRELVPGDLVRIRLGEIVPADIKLIEGDFLQVDESSLTGESLPVEKKVSEVAFSGSIVRQGEMTALVFATGMNTYFGRTAKLVELAKTQSHFQKAVVKIGDYLIILAAVLVTIIFIVATQRHESFLQTLQFALVLVVAAIPAALPAVLSVTMAVGAMELAKKEAIVSRLTAIEEMAGVDVLCSDKTGTITQNAITVAEVVPFEGFSQKDVLLFGALASREEDGDLIDVAIIKKSKEVQVETASYKLGKFKPFDPVSKRTLAEIEGPQGSFGAAKGAPQAILSLAANSTAGASVDQSVKAFASKGYRALGVASTDSNGAWHYAGLIALQDPPREDSAETINTAQSLGVRIKMVTGDHVDIAKEIAQMVGLGTNIRPPSDFIDKSDEDATDIIEKADGFAQVFPEHKFKIVELLQARGHIVGMTGDGVNDAPALKKADAGIAVSGATDAAKSAAAIVLTRKGLSVIIDAIKESRKIFRRMNSYAIYRIAETIRVLFFITLSIIIFNFYPVTAIMIVLLALLNDFAIMSIAYDRAEYALKPSRWDMTNVLGMATFLGLVGTVASFILFFIGVNVLHLSKDVLQSMMYLKLSVAGHFLIFITRTKGHFWSYRPSNILLVAVFGTQIVATIIAVYGLLIPAIGWSLALFVWVYSMTSFVLTDLAKVFLFKRFEREVIMLKKEAMAIGDDDKKIS
ncbi:MAG: plasma-membrane proton-efflux P-type ATPase [Methanothrix sp.]|nr:plasma-membrane proton-efflux P-type ATPase [Methanothrix sp.]HPA97264.1 plasma-membrane proton-efflux P-type ATPase [Methanothrix sp.]